MKERESWLKLRIVFVFAFFIAFFGLIAGRALQVQIFNGGNLERIAVNQHSTTLTLNSKRGALLDRKNKELAVSLDVDSIFLRPHEIKNKKEAINILKEELSISSSKLRKKINSSKKFIWVKRQAELTKESRERIASVEGVGVVKESKRYYPGVSLTSNLLGFVGLDSKGLEGAELYYDSFLAGGIKKVRAEKDARGRLILFDDMSSQGMDIVLTIDKNIQYITEKALARAVNKYNAKGATAVVMNPKTGEILAMATLPTFDPNGFKNFTPKDWRNRAVTDAFEPGSTMKPFLLASVLEEDVAKLTDIFFCENGKYNIKDRTFHDTKEHGWLSLKNIVKYSSNIGSAKVGEKLGKEKYYSYLKKFGFGEKTGIDLPGESRGLLSHYTRWSGVTLHTISFGQGIAVTTLQMTNALSAIANGGYLMRPYVVKEIRGDSEHKKTFEPLIIEKVMSGETARQVKDVMVSVTEGDGTGLMAAVPGFRVAGKTGTAQKVDFKKGGYARGKYVSSFMGFAPADDARLAVYVAVDEPKGFYSGGYVAGPVFKEIIFNSFRYMGVSPDQVVPLDDEEIKIMEATYKGESEVNDEDLLSKNIETISNETVPSFKGMTMRRAMARAKDAGLEIEIEGSGIAYKQNPYAGKDNIGNKEITVWFN